MRSGTAVALAIVAGALAPAAARADVWILRPGPEGQDTAPYEFMPSASRGNRESLWAFTDPGGEHSFESYLRFALPPDLLAPGESVAQALLTVYYAIDSVSFGESGDGPGVLECRPVLEAWDESSVTWIAKPAVGAPVDVAEGITGLGSVLCDVTELANAWAEGSAVNHGIALTNPTNRLLGFYSSDAEVADGLRPGLIVETVPEPGRAAGAAAAGALLALAERARRNRS